MPEAGDVYTGGNLYQELPLPIRTKGRTKGFLCILLLLLLLNLPGCALTGLLPAKSIAPAPNASASDPQVSASGTASSRGDAPSAAIPIRSEADLQTARRQRRNGELAAALSLYREIAAGREPSPQVLFELGQVELEIGQAPAAYQTVERLMARIPNGPLQQRALLLQSAIDLALGRWESVLQSTDVAGAADGLADLAILYRAEAMMGAGKPDQAKLQLTRRELVESTNRVLLERAGNLAERAGDHALAAELYLRGSKYPTWTMERSKLIGLAAAAFDKAGQADKAVEQYRRLVETYTWMKVGKQAGERLVQLGGLTAYHHGLLDLNYESQEEARAALKEETGAYTEAAQRLLAQLDEGNAWQKANDAATADAYQSFRSQYPKSAMAGEAWFQEGLAHYVAGRPAAALNTWEEAATSATGDNRARLLLWSGKALNQLSRESEGRARLQEAAGTKPAGYYTVRARDLLANVIGWPGLGTGAIGEQRQEEQLPAQPTPTPSSDTDMEKRVRRGLGFLALGMRREAAAELDGLIAESQDTAFLLRLAEELTAQELWSSAARAAARIAALSAGKTVASSPVAVRSLAYPTAYPDLVCSHSAKNNLDPLLLLALIRQESAYDPFALSVSDARGLAQVIPSTGRGIASALGRQGFGPDDLHLPVVGIEFGAYYLGDQLKRFNGDAFQAVAAYNSGAGPVPRWASPDPDLFVERIDYSQTRDYVRGVYLHHAIYRSLGRGSICP